MTKSILTKQALEQAALLEIRSRFGCQAVLSVEVELAYLRQERNWRITTVHRNPVGYTDQDLMNSVNDSYAVAATETKLGRVFALKI